MATRLQDAKIRIDLETEEALEELSRLEGRIRELEQSRRSADVADARMDAKKVARNQEEKRQVKAVRDFVRPPAAQQVARQVTGAAAGRVGFGGIGTLGAALAVAPAICAGLATGVSGVAAGAARAFGAGPGIIGDVANTVQGLVNKINFLTSQVSSLFSALEKTKEFAKAQAFLSESGEIGITSLFVAQDQFRAIDAQRKRLEKRTQDDLAFSLGRSIGKTVIRNVFGDLMAPNPLR